MATEDTPAGGPNQPPVVALYGVTIRGGIQRQNLTELKSLLTQAQAQLAQQGDIRAALAGARLAHAKLTTPQG